MYVSRGLAEICSFARPALCSWRRGVPISEVFYKVVCEKSLPSSWLLSEAVRRHMEDHDEQTEKKGGEAVRI